MEVVQTKNPMSPPDAMAATILVVDDSRINLKAVSRMLVGHFRVLTAESDRRPWRSPPERHGPI
ncbi:MAG: hypothetical protein IPJ73_19845 [Zoogloea sp.]|nr:hypothetical protein [Zoogloea sp.]